MSGSWVEIDEAEDVAGSIRHVLFVRSAVEDDPHAWKWLMLALHSALQGACVCHLTTSAAPLGAVTSRNAKEWMLYFRSDLSGPPPPTYLMALPDLLKELRKPFSAGDSSNGDGIAIDDQELAWLTRFHEDIRNQFVHFSPLLWAIDVSGVPAIAGLIARIILEIDEVGYAFRHLEGAQRQAMRLNLQELASQLWQRTS